MLEKWTIVLMAGLLTACGTLPTLEGRGASIALMGSEAEDTRLGKGLKPLVEQHRGLSSVVPLSDALDAFASQMLLIAAAQRTIDVQYYIWRDDIQRRFKSLGFLGEFSRLNCRMHNKSLTVDGGVHTGFSIGANGRCP